MFPAMKDMEGRLARRAALKIIGQSVVGAAVLGAARLAQAEACDAKVDPKSKQMRKALQYVDESKKAGQSCEKCLQYKAPGAGESCGGCKLFTGPVKPGGYCLSFAPAKK